MRKFLITAELRDLEKQVSLGEIIYSKMIETLCEKAENHLLEFYKFLEKEGHFPNSTGYGVFHIKRFYGNNPCNNCQGCGCTLCNGSGFLAHTGA